MSEFAFLFRGRDHSGSPAQMQRTVEKWVAWIDGLRRSGHLHDRGNPLDDRAHTISGVHRIVNDGPYVETKDIVNGYMLIKAAGLDDAVELSKGCPILDDGGSIEVRPVMKL